MNRTGRSFVVAALALALTGGTAWSQAPEDPSKAPPNLPEPPEQEAEPQPITPAAPADLSPGDRAPDFEVDSSIGAHVTMRDILGHWSVLIFDPDRAVFATLAPAADSIAAMGARAFGICGDDPASSAAWARSHHLGFTLLCDPTGEVSGLFHMYDPALEVTTPGLVVIDPEGTVRMVLRSASLHARDVEQLAGHAIRGA